MRSVTAKLGEVERKFKIRHATTMRLAPLAQLVLPSMRDGVVTPPPHPDLCLAFSGAVLGSFWADGRPPWPDLMACDGDIVAYGDGVVDALVEQGLTMQQVSACMFALWPDAMRSFPAHKEELAEAKDFSEAQAASTSG